MTLHPHRILSTLLLFFLLAGCIPSDDITAKYPWRYGDLRLLDLPGDAPSPQQDIIAAYARLRGDTLEVRLDLLDMRSAYPTGELWLFIKPLISTERYILARFPVSGGNSVNWLIREDEISPVIGTGATLLADPDLDTLTLRFNTAALGGSPRRFTLQAFLFASSFEAVADSTTTFRVDGSSPPRAPILLAFSDTLPAATPVQALRRWDGAHTGPSGRRHGLANLLDAAERNRVPLTLLDLKQPDSLAALDVLGGLEQVQRMARSGQLLLADSATTAPKMTTRSLALQREATKAFGLPTSPVLYGPTILPLPQGYQAAFASAAFPGSALAEVQNTRLISLAGATTAAQVDDDGLSLELRAALVEAAMQPQPPLTVLGGSLPASSWGDLDVANAVFGYIAAHPWIHPFNAIDLLLADGPVLETIQLAQGCDNLLCQSALPLPADLAAWLAAPATQADTVLRQHAFQTILRMTSPTVDSRHADLQLSYLSQLELLAQAARWANAPYAMNTCNIDLDNDGILECLLVNQAVFAVILPNDAELVLAVWIQDGVAQIGVLPSSLLAIQLIPQAGLSGGFGLDTTQPFQPSAAPGSLALAASSGESVTYQLDDARLLVTFDQPASVTIPLAPGSAARTHPGWVDDYSITPDPSGHSIRVGAPGLTLMLETSAGSLTADSWRDSLAWMRQPEDPDREYPPGHFLPYPMTVVTIQSGEPFTVTLETEP